MDDIHRNFIKLKKMQTWRIWKQWTRSPQIQIIWWYSQERERTICTFNPTSWVKLLG